jgi:hypothetical protein
MRAWLKALLADAGRVEIRHLPSGKSIVVDDLEQAQAAIASRSGSGNLYTTINRPGAHIEVGSTAAVKDADIERVVLLPFDFDPLRQSDRASTSAELQAAIAARDAFVRAMASRGWPTPALACSGNGAHAVYRVLLPNDDNTMQMLRALYTGLTARYSDEEVAFDPVVRNPARIWRLYGSTNRKGTPTQDRPHRIATVRLPADWRRVSAKEVERLASEFVSRKIDRPSESLRDRPRLAGRGDYASLDIVGWFAAHESYVGHLGGNVHEVDCPWEHEHTSRSPRDTIAYSDDGRGWPGFFCHHGHCAGRTIRDVIALWQDADAWCARQWRGRAA